MGGGHHRINGQNGVEFRKGAAAECDERGRIDGAVRRAIMVKAGNLALRNRPAVRPKQDDFGVGLSGVNNGNSTRQL